MRRGKFFVLILAAFLSKPTFAIVGVYLKSADQNTCDIITKYQDGATRRCTAVKISDRTLLSVKHCDEEAIFGSEKVKKTAIVAFCPNEKPKSIVGSELHRTADIGVFAVDAPFDTPPTSFKLSASDSEEQELIRTGKCSSWGYGPDNKTKMAPSKG